MRQITLMLPILFFISGCLDFQGSFQANETLNLVHTTVFGNEKIVKIPAGSYFTEVGFSSENKLKLTFRSGDKEISAKLKLPKDLDFSNSRGEIYLPANRTGQLYHITGNVDTTTTRSRLYRVYEACNYTDYRVECRQVCDANGCRHICERIAYNRPGQQFVEYHFVTTERDIDLKFVTPRSNSIVGDYQGHDTQTEKVYQQQGICR